MFAYYDGDVPRRALYGVYISELIRFARVSSYITFLNARNKLLTAKVLNQRYRYHQLRKAFSKFYRRNFDLVSKFNVGHNLFSNKAYRSLNFMVTKNINSGKYMLAIILALNFVESFLDI